MSLPYDPDSWPANWILQLIAKDQLGDFYNSKQWKRFRLKLLKSKPCRCQLCVILLLRNLAVGAAAALFLVSLFHLPCRYLLKAIAYFFGAAAYFCEILLLTDCFTQKVPHREMFMAYCFGPMYILLGISYLFH